MQAYCPVSFALKLAVFCLVLGVVVGAWLSAELMGQADSPPSLQPTNQLVGHQE
ncbi:hypothetical protein [Actinophytocola gossypii]|uniref:Uncharacterized protein n=1 Tax=Actinophytocola gossypii TaxID=2812003 RepID=A0ABT2J5A5_9PSEU|nr:hypothetical protein [Actinophytocola gossypii]MCT2582670.1 hypothetical protein [Actinophytocola gossypii]